MVHMRVDRPVVYQPEVDIHVATTKRSGGAQNGENDVSGRTTQRIEKQTGVRRVAKRSMSRRAVACVLVLLAVASALPASSQAASTADVVFTVANYPVEARAKDAVTAKNTALADGQQSALRSLMRRLVPVTAYRRLKSMPKVKAADLIDGVSVKEERNSTTDYIATLDFAFQPAAIRTLLQRNGIPFVDSQAPQTLVIPLYRAKADAPFESGQGMWYDAWKGLDLVHTLAPAKLDKLKPEIHADTLQALAAQTLGADRVFASAYETDRVIVALAEPDASEKRLNVTLTGTDAVGAFTLKRSYKISGGDKAYTAELAAIIGLGVLEGRWKAAKAGAVGGVDVDAVEGGGLQVIVEFNSLSEWNDIRTRILATEGAFDVAIGSVSARSADVNLRHPGGSKGLVQAMAGNGLKLTNESGVWLVHSTF
jgi:hypothetical protein